MENLAGPSTSFCFRASVSQKLKRDRESGELDTFLTLERNKPDNDYLAVFIQLEPKELRDEPDALLVNRFRKLWSSLNVCGARDRSRLSPHRARVSPSHTQIPFTSVCPRHRGWEDSVRDQFVVQLEEEERAQYLDNRQIYLDWLPACTSRTIKLNFICSNRCYIHTESEYYLNLKISLEDPISGDVKGYDTVAVIPP